MPDAFEEQAVLVAAEQAAAEGDAARRGGTPPQAAGAANGQARARPRRSRFDPPQPGGGVRARRPDWRSGRLVSHAPLSTVAAAALPPTDQLVVRCQEDLNAFLEARLMPLPAMAFHAVSVAPLSRRRPAARRRHGVAQGGPPAPAARSGPGSSPPPADEWPPPPRRRRPRDPAPRMDGRHGRRRACWSRRRLSPAGDVRAQSRSADTVAAESSASTAPAKPPPRSTGTGEEGRRPPATLSSPPPRASGRPRRPRRRPRQTPRRRRGPGSRAPAHPPAPRASRRRATRAANPAAITVTDARICRQLSTARGLARAPRPSNRSPRRAGSTSSPASRCRARWRLSIAGTTATR